MLVDVMSRPAEPASASHRPLSRYLRRLAVDLNSIDSPASRPHIFAVGGSDTWLRMYDRRMTSSNGDVQVRRTSFLMPEQVYGNANGGSTVQ